MMAPLLLLLGSLGVAGRSSAAAAASWSSTAAVDTRAPLSVVDPAFLSFNIDAAELRQGFPWNSTVLAARARHLAPLKLRIGGGAQSHSVYDTAFLHHELPQITGLAAAMNASLVWGTAPCKTPKQAKNSSTCDMRNAEALVQSAAAAGIAEWEFGNEPGAKGGVDSARFLARAFVQFKKLLASRFPHAPLIGPDVGYGAWAAPLARGSADGDWVAAFFEAAAPVLDGATVHIYPFDHNDVGGDAHLLASSGRIGASAADPACASEVGPNLPWCNYTRVMWPGPGELFDTSPVQSFALPFADIVRQYAPNAAKSLRVGETAAVNHGGWDNVTNAYVSGFWGVYEMGWLAQGGYHVMHRQSLTCRAGYSGMGGGEKCAYGVLNTAPAFEPAPDYWLAVLHKRLMGTIVLNASATIAVPQLEQAAAAGGGGGGGGEGGSAPPPADGRTSVSKNKKTTAAADDRGAAAAGSSSSGGGGSPIATPRGLEGVVRLFAHCSLAAAGGGGGGGGVTLMFANPQTAVVSLSLPPELAHSGREAYILTPAADGSGNPPLQSKKVGLNGRDALELVADGSGAKVDLPPMLPAKQPAGKAMMLPALSYGFFVLPDAQATACK